MDEFYDMPREFDIIGSCVFHKGLLLISHLSKDNLVDVILWCKSKNLFSLTQTRPIGQLVSWIRIFPTRTSGE